MRRADRLFQLMRTLRSRGFATGQQLADELGVSKRTVYRDVRDLESSGVPIRGEAGVGYRLEPGFEMPPLTFSAAEVEALVLGARIVGAWGDAEMAESAKSALQRFEAVLPERLGEVVNRTPLFAPDFHRRQELTDQLPLIREAIGLERCLRFGYTRADGTASARTVRPFGLYFWGKAWTLASWCENRGDYRSFRPDRMTSLEMLESGFDPAEGPSLQGFLDDRSQDEDEWFRRPLSVEPHVTRVAKVAGERS